MRLLVLLALLAGCTSRPAPEASGGAVVGTVTAVDMSPMAYDGDGIITVQTESGATVQVLIAARMNLCKAEGLATDVSVGDRIEVVGTPEARSTGPQPTEASGAIRPCASAEHRLAVLGS